MRIYKFNKSRNVDGVYQIKADDINSYAYGLAEAHCEDRFLQMEMLRLICKGKLCEKLKADDETLQIDKFMRKVGFYKNLESELEKISPETKFFLDSYLEGVNDFLIRGKLPFEFKLVGHHPTKWEVEDIMATIKIMSYIGLAQTQEEMEKFIFKLIHLEYPIKKLKLFFSPLLNDLTQETIDQIQSLKFSDFTMPDLGKYKPPSIKNSNNWVLGNKKTKTKDIMACADPHLEVNRLPAIWYECVAQVNDMNFLGITMPGVPGLIMGRNDKVSYSFTYGFMDLVDFFIEDIKENRIKRGNEYVKLDLITETIKRKGQSDYIFSFYEKDGNFIESRDFVNENCKLEDGFYLSKLWYGQSGVANTLNALFKFHFCKTAEEVKKYAQDISISCNWLITDQKNIVYQQSGQLPKRKGNGIIPLPGWVEGNINTQKNDNEKLMSIVNPASGFLCTANNSIQMSNHPVSINLAMGDYRYRRIKSMLESRNDFDCENLKKMQCDLYSIQAQEFIDQLMPLLPDSEIKTQLINWDKCYTKKSTEAYLFEKFYRNLIKDIFGSFLGISSWEEILDQTPISIDYYHFFDNIILDKDKYKGKSKRALWFDGEANFIKQLQTSSQNTFTELSAQVVKTYGEYNTTWMNHLFFAGKLPKFLGFDYGPVQIEGSRATIVQGVVYTSHKRNATFCPSWRFISNMGQSWAYTVLAGGVSDRRFSKYFKSDISNWINFKYKKISFLD